MAGSEYTGIMLKQIFIYPLKSARGILLPEAEADERGLAGDRRFMVVNRLGRFISQRSHPRMALVQTALTEGRLEIMAPGMPRIEFPFPLTSGEEMEVRIWQDTCRALDAGAKAAEWFMRFLKEECRLVFLPPGEIRSMPKPHAAAGHSVSFADAFPFLLISQGSLDDLNQRLQQPLLMDRFRPNLVVTGCPPYAEDGWNEIQIGDIRFNVAKPCSRCVTTTVDQQSGEKGGEPLVTLAGYRRRGDAVYFGQNLVHLNRGRLRIGDALTVLRAIPADSP